MTLDDAINELTKLKQKLPGDTSILDSDGFGISLLTKKIGRRPKNCIVSWVKPLSKFAHFDENLVYNQNRSW